MKFHADIHVTLKPLVNDPPGLVIRDALRNLGFDEVATARSGKYLQLDLTAPTQKEANARVEAMCQKLLSNPVIEDYEFRVQKIVQKAAARVPAKA